MRSLPPEDHRQPEPCAAFNCGAKARPQSNSIIYDLIEKGDKSRDVRLLPGDVIFIPPIGPQIAISGDVNQPGIYELKGETTVGAALETAGGVTSLADAERAVLGAD